MRTIYGQSSSATADTSSAGAARARRLGAGLVIAGALFGSAAPAQADDGLTVGGLSGGSIEATVATAQGAAVTQATAIVNEAMSAAASSGQSAPAPAPAEPQTGSASGVAADTSSEPPTAPAPAAAQPGAPSPAAAPTAPATTTAPVVAPSAPVVSPPADDTPAASSPDATPVPSAAFDRLAREYQQNPGRYHSLNSLPISHGTGAVSGLQSLVKRAPFVDESSAPNSGSIPASTPRVDLPDSAPKSGGEESISQPSHAHVGAVANSAPADSSAATHPETFPVGAVEESSDRLAGVAATAGQPLVLHHVTARAATPRPAAATAHVGKAAPQPTVNASTGPASAPSRADAGSAPRHNDRPRGPRLTVRTETAARASAFAHSESTWPWLGLALLIAGLTSISLAIASVGDGVGAAMTAVAARLRETPQSVTGIATRMRSKGLSAGAKGTVADRPHERRGIRYRD